MKRALILTSGALLCAMAASEAIDQAASRLRARSSAELAQTLAARRAGTADRDPTQAFPSAVLVILGYGQNGERANLVNRFRLSQALRTATALQREGWTVTLVPSGGAVRGRTTEAKLLDDEAHRRGWRGTLIREDSARTTWENVANTLPQAERADAFAYISHPLHSLLARIYLGRQRPDLTGRVIRAKDYRFLEWGPLRVGTTIIGLRALYQLRNREQLQQR